MLSDHERKTLQEIQRHLVVDDPDFERTFRTLATPTPDPTALSPALRWWMYTAVIVIAAFLATVSLLAGSVGGTLAFSVIAGAVWCAQHLETAATRRELDD